MDASYLDAFPQVWLLLFASRICYMHSSAGASSIKLQHTQVTRAAKYNATRDGGAFTIITPLVGAPSLPPTPSQSAARL